MMFEQTSDIVTGRVPSSSRALTAADAARLQELEKETKELVALSEKVLGVYTQVFSECVAAHIAKTGSGAVCVDVMVAQARNVATIAAREFAKHAVSDVIGARNHAHSQMTRAKWLAENK